MPSYYADYSSSIVHINLKVHCSIYQTKNNVFQDVNHEYSSVKKVDLYTINSVADCYP